MQQRQSANGQQHAWAVALETDNAEQNVTNMVSLLKQLLRQDLITLREQRRFEACV